MRRVRIITSAAGLVLVGSSLGGGVATAADRGPTCEGYKDVAST